MQDKIWEKYVTEEILLMMVAKGYPKHKVCDYQQCVFWLRENGIPDIQHIVMSYLFKCSYNEALNLAIMDCIKLISVRVEVKVETTLEFCRVMYKRDDYDLYHECKKLDWIKAIDNKMSWIITEIVKGNFTYKAR